MLTYKALLDLALQYLAELFIPYMPRRNLRSSQSGLLAVSKNGFALWVTGLFAFHAPKLWLTFGKLNPWAFLNPILKCFISGWLLIDFVYYGCFILFVVIVDVFLYSTLRKLLLKALISYYMQCYSVELLDVV